MYITKSKIHEYTIQFVLLLKRNRILDRSHLLLIDSHKSHVYGYPFLQFINHVTAVYDYYSNTSELGWILLANQVAGLPDFGEPA